MSSRVTPAVPASNSGSEFDLQPDPRILPMLGEINLVQWKCIAELVDNSIDGFLDARAAGKAIEQPEVHVSTPMRADVGAQVVVRDNGPGMTPEMLERAARAGWSGNDPTGGKLGLFGMGFNIATARLGGVTTVWTSRAGDRERVGLRIDFDQLRNQRHFRTPRLTEPKTDRSQHGTEVIIQKLKPEQRDWFARSGNRTKMQNELSRSYAAMLRKDGVPLHFRLHLNGTPVPSRRHCIWGGPGNEPRIVTTSKGSIDAFQPIDIVSNDRPYCSACWQWLAVDERNCPSCGSAERVSMRKRIIRGWLGLQRYLDESDYGIDFIRNGRKIEVANRELFYWYGLDGETQEQEYPLDDPRHRGRIVGEIHLDHCRVAYTKDRFDRSDPAWEEMRIALRGNGPLRPDKADDLGLSGNTSPLYKLFQAFRRSSPKPKIAGGWKKLLVVPNNDLAREFARKFDEGAPGYETDAKWWNLIEEEERKLLTGVTPAPGAPPTGGAPTPGPTLPGFGPPSPTPGAVPTPGVASPIPTPPEPPRTRIAALSRQYISHLTGVKWQLEAYRVDARHSYLEGKRPWAVRALTNGVHEFYVDEEHPIFQSATMTTLDGLLSELAWLAADARRGQVHEFTFGSILADLREKYAKSSALDPVTLAHEARQALTAIAATLPKNVEPSDAPVLFRSLSGDDQKAILSQMAARGAPKPQSVIGSGRFLEFAPARVISKFFSAHPELFLDGNCWDDPYATLEEFEDPTAVEIARTQVVRRYESLLSDAVWLAERDPSDLAHASRPRLLRAMHAVELLTPTEEAR